MGISFSTGATRRRNATPYCQNPHYPPTPYPVDYYPYPALPPPPPHVPNPYYTSNAYCACYHANPLVGHPNFGAFHPQNHSMEWQTLPPRVVNEQKRAKVVRSDVNVHKDSVRLEMDELNPDRQLVSFVFDAMMDGSITIYYFTKEDGNCRLISLFPETYVPIKIFFKKGLHQEFRQPSGTGIDLRFLDWDYISNSSSRGDIFPIIISAETFPPPYETTYTMLPQMQITQAIVAKYQEAQFTAKVVRQLLWTDGISYELREIYGFGKSDPGCSESGSGKECVICMTEPKDIAVLPCRHMCMCSNCANTLRLQSNKCPICRETIESFLEIKIDNVDQ